MTIAGAPEDVEAVESRKGYGKAYDGPGALLRGLIGGGVAGAGGAAVLAGAVLSRTPLILVGVGLLALDLVVLVALANLRFARSPRPPARLALAVVEERRRVDGEDSIPSYRFDLSVVPDGDGAYRTTIDEPAGEWDLYAYRVGAVVVVSYRPDRRWQTEIVTAPPPQWAERAAECALDSVPRSATIHRPFSASFPALLAIAGVLAGAAAVFLPLGDPLLKELQPSSTSTSSSSSSSTTTTYTVTSRLTMSELTSTVTIAATGEPMLEAGRMRSAVTSVTSSGGPTRAVQLGFDSHTMTVWGGTRSAAGTDPLFDLKAIPYERLPGLVRDAQAHLGVRNLTSWSIAVGHDRGDKKLVIRVTVSGADGVATLDADPTAKVVHRTPIH